MSQKCKEDERSRQYLPFKILQNLDLFASENDLDEPQNTEFKRTIKNSIKGFKEKFKKDTKKQDSELKKRNIKRINF